MKPETPGMSRGNAGRTPILLLPWDPTNETHFQRLYNQRVACSWAWDEVASWRERMLDGNKLVYWITLSQDAPGRAEMLKAHADEFPLERDALADTAASLGRQPRAPTEAAFLPVGHVALEAFPDRNARFALPAGTWWAKSLYVSRALRGLGIGRSAMGELERIAARPPFSCSFLALDTMTGAFERLFYSQLDQQQQQQQPQPHAEDGEPALAPPSQAGPPRRHTNEDWYLRQGYQVIGHQDDLYQQPKAHPEPGEWTSAPGLFLKKPLA